MHIAETFVAVRVSSFAMTNHQTTLLPQPAVTLRQETWVTVIIFLWQCFNMNNQNVPLHVYLLLKVLKCFVFFNNHASVLHFHSTTIRYLWKIMHTHGLTTQWREWWICGYNFSMYNRVLKVSTLNFRFYTHSVCVNHSSYSRFDISANLICKANRFIQGAVATLINLTGVQFSAVHLKFIITL